MRIQTFKPKKHAIYAVDLMLEWTGPDEGCGMYLYAIVIIIIIIFLFVYGHSSPLLTIF